MCTIRGGLLAFFVLISFSVSAADFYWIGNSGVSTYLTNWSDPKNWSHTSGGAPLVDEIPGADDHVIFDEHGSGEVEIDVAHPIVRHFTVRDIAQPITFNYWKSNRIFISGNIEILTQDISFMLLRLCPVNGEVVKVKSKARIDKLDIDGEGTVELASDLEVGELQMDQGVLKTNDYALNLSTLRVYKGTLDVGDADVNVNTEFTLSQGADFVGKNFHLNLSWCNAQVEGDIKGQDFQVSTIGTAINLNGKIVGNNYQITGKGAYFTVGTSGVVKGGKIGMTMDDNQLVMYGRLEAEYSRVDLKHGGLYDYLPNQISFLQVQDSSYLGSNIHTDTLMVAAGAKLEFGVGCTTTVDKYFEVKGTEEAMAFIGKWEKNERSSLICKEKAIVNYAMIRNLQNASASILKASNSVDMGNNLRWEFESLPGLKFYRKGGSGNWRDLTAWFMDEGFSQPAKRLPTAVDDVYLAGNEMTIYGDEKMYNACHDLISEEGKYLSFSQTVHVFGDVDLKGNGSVSDLVMFTKGKNECFVGEGYSVWSLDMNDFKDPEGKEECWFDLKSAIRCNYYFLSGSLRTNDWDITSEYIYWNKGVGDKEFLDIKGSEIRCPSIWIYHDSIVSGNSRIVVTEVAYDRGQYVYENYRNSFIIGSPQRDFVADRGIVCIPYDTVAHLAVTGRATAESFLFVEKLELLPDCDFSLREETYAGELLFGGKVDSLVKIRNTQGMTKLKVAAARTQQVNYCLIDSVSVEGTTVTAGQSWLYTPGCSGWQIKSPEVQQLYWVGGAGRWSDLDHWALSSGGNNKAARIPMPGDQVVVDHNSGLDKNKEITLDLINQVVGDLDIQVPCQIAMGNRGRKLNVSGSLKMQPEVQGQLYELWLWGKKGQESLLQLSGTVTTDMIFQKQGNYQTQGNVKTGYFIVYDGKIQVKDTLDLICFKVLAADAVVLKQAVVDVADWQVTSTTLLAAEKAVLSCYPRKMAEGITTPGLSTQGSFGVEVSTAFFATDETLLYDQVKFYGSVNTTGLTGKSFYVAPASSIVNAGTVKSDTIILLGEIESNTLFYGGKIEPVEYAFFDGILFSGTLIPEGSYTAWFCYGVNSEPMEPFNWTGVQLVRGGHLCNIDSVDLIIPHVMRDSFEWVKGSEVVSGSSNLDTLEIRQGGDYFCRIYGKLGTAVSNTFQSIHERDFQVPRLLFTGDSVLCQLDHESFNLGITAVNEDSQGHLGFRWFMDEQPDPVAEGDFLAATAEGCYQVEIYGYACRDTFPVACTRWVTDVPDQSLLVSLGAPARHCPGESILIGIQKVNPGIDTLWYSWTKGEQDLNVNTDTLRVVEDDHYTVALNNICGATQPGITFDVVALTPPEAPWQDTVASRCGPGEVKVRLGGVKGNTIRWYDAEEEILHTGVDTSWRYPDIQTSTFRIVDVVDQDHCVSEKTTLELKIDDVKVPLIKVVGDTLQCPPDEVFQVELTASTTGTQQDLIYYWYQDEVEIASGSTPSLEVTAKGIYRVEIQGFACYNRGEEHISLRVLDGPPDPALMHLNSVPVHCPGTEIEISIEPIPVQRDTVWIRWQKEGVELSAETNTLRVIEDGVYQVNIANLCGFSSEWKEIPVTAVIPPQAPIQDGVATRCGPGELAVRLQGTNTQNYTVIWMDEEQKVVASGKHYLFDYPEVQESGYRYVRFQDADQCLGEIGQLQLTIFEVPEVDLGGDREVEYKHQLAIEAIELPDEGTFRWSPCSRLDACDVREPVFLAGAQMDNFYRLEYTTTDGCLVADSLMIHVYVEYHFPDMITPNGDGFNDVWKIYGLELCAETNELWIYDYTGKEVYHAHPYRDDWDGKSDKGDELKPGSYIYKFTPDGELILTGMVSLIRQ